LFDAGSIRLPARTVSAGRLSQDDTYRALAASVVLLAIEDLQEGSPSGRESAQLFFQSVWFEFLVASLDLELDAVRVRIGEMIDASETPVQLPLPLPAA
jgi:hypothetical protein